MHAQGRQNIPWLSRPLGELSRLAWPIAVSMLGYSLMTVVDTAFVGRLGAAALAGVGLGGIAAFTLLVFSLGLLRGVKVLVSQSVGAGRAREADTFRGAGIVAALALGLVTVALGQAVALVLPLAAASRQAGELASLYLAIRILGSPALLIYVALREARYGLGEARLPMVATLVANTVNIALDFALIFGAGLGVAGAALASVAAHVVEAAVLFTPAAFRRESLRRGLSALGELWRVGLPTGLQFLIEVGSFTLLSVMIAAMSEVQMAAHQIALHALHFSFLPAVAVSEAGSVLAGQAVGADRDDLVGKVASLSMGLVGGYALAFTAILALFAPEIAGWFSTDARVVAAASGLLYAAVFFQLADGANIVARGVLRGTGDVRFPAVVGIGLAWALTPPLCWLLGMRWGLGALGGWIGLCAEIIAGAAIFWHRLWRQGWRPAAIRSREALGIESVAPGP